jgi:hypothetical protein
MQSALHITTKVLPGNKIEVQLPPGSEGKEINVFVTLPVPTLSLVTSNSDTHFVEIANLNPT